MKLFSWQILLGLSLIALSALFYLGHYAVFKDAHHIFIYLIGDIAFVPIEVLMVTMIIHRLLEMRGKRAKMEKLNMVIEIFFSEMGTEILNVLSCLDPKQDDIRKYLIVTNDWSEKNFLKVNKRLKNYKYQVDIKKLDLQGFRRRLLEKREFMLRLLENPVLLEHESFTDLLRAVSHLTEELAYRDDVSLLPATDLEHLSGDAKRVYGLLVHQWLDYMKYLKNNYPYLFSLAMRINPFDQTSSAIVK